MFYGNIYMIDNKCVNRLYTNYKYNIINFKFMC